MKATLSERERRVLEVFADSYKHECVLLYDHIATWSGLEFRSARIATRSLRRLGYVALTSCFDDDGFVRGSGHICTKSGFEKWQTLQGAA